MGGAGCHLVSPDVTPHVPPGHGALLQVAFNAPPAPPGLAQLLSIKRISPPPTQTAWGFFWGVRANHSPGEALVRGGPRPPR